MIRLESGFPQDQISTAYKWLIDQIRYMVDSAKLWILLVDGKGFEPSASALRTRRSPS